MAVCFVFGASMMVISFLLSVNAFGMAMGPVDANAGLGSMNNLYSDIYTVSESSKLITGDQKADLALLGRRAVLEQQGMSEEEIKKEIEDLEKTVSKWRTGKPALPPELVNMVKEGENADITEDMTYGELEKLVSLLSDRLMANQNNYAKESPKDVNKMGHYAPYGEATLNANPYASEMIDERELARRHGARNDEIPGYGQSLHDLHVKGVVEGEMNDGKCHDDVTEKEEARSYSKISMNKRKGKQAAEKGTNKQNVNSQKDTKKQFGNNKNDDRFANLKNHPLNGKGSADRERLNKDKNISENCALSQLNGNADGNTACDALLEEEIEIARKAGVTVNQGTFNANDLRKTTLDWMVELEGNLNSNQEQVVEEQVAKDQPISPDAEAKYRQQFAEYFQEL